MTAGNPLLSWVFVATLLVLIVTAVLPRTAPLARAWLLTAAAILSAVVLGLLTVASAQAEADKLKRGDGVVWSDYAPADAS